MSRFLKGLQLQSLGMLTVGLSHGPFPWAQQAPQGRIRPRAPLRGCQALPTPPAVHSLLSQGLPPTAQST